MAIELTFELVENAHKLRAVTNHSPLKAGKFKYTDDGLYSEPIFGPLKNFSCACGALFSRENKGLRCTTCDVLCDTTSTRSTLFGRIDLPANIYIIMPNFRQLVISMFGQNAIKTLLDDKKYEVNKQKPYFYSLNQQKLIKGSNLKPSEKRILKEVYDIHTLHSLYKSMLKHDTLKQNLLKHMVDERISKYIFSNFILVTPPDSRPLIKINKQYQAHAATAAYTEILKNIHNSFLDKAFKSKSEGFGRTIYKYQASIDKLYALDAEKSFQKKESILRESLAGKTVETSQRATIVPEPILSPGSIGMSEESIKKMFQPELLHFLHKVYDENSDESNMTDFAKTVHDQVSPSGEITISNELFDRFLEEVGPELRMMLERPPVLWRYNISGVTLGLVFPENGHIGIKQDRIIAVNSLIAAFFNLDYDGDNLATYAVSSKQGRADFNFTYIENQIEFEHHRGLLVSPEHESIYASYMLSLKGNEEYTGDVLLEAESLYGLKVSISILNNAPNTPIYIKDLDITIPYNIAIINKAINLNCIIYDGSYLLKKSKLKYLMKLIREEIDDSEFYSYIHNFDKFLLECSTIVHYCNPTFALDDFAIHSDEIVEYKKTLIEEPYIAFHQNEILFKEFVVPKVRENGSILAPVSDSGARIKNVQLLKAASNNGIPTNIYGRAFKKNIKNSLLEGLTEYEFYMSGDSARLALAQRQEAIPKGGELQRKFFFATGFLKLSDTYDCGSTKGLLIKIQDETHLESLYSRYFVSGEQIDVNDKSQIGKSFVFRSPHRCKISNYHICTKCFGSKKPQSKSLGAAIGSYISESIIQSVLRTHHFSGAFITNINPTMMKLIKKLDFVSPNIINYKDEQDVLDLEKLIHSSKYYDSNQMVEFKKSDDIENQYTIEQHELPFNDDSVKQLNNIVGMIDRNRDLEKMYTPEEMYDFLLENIVLPNGILSIYIELVISILYYDEDNTMIRYSDKDIDHQLALKRVIDRLDPKLAIFHNFSNKAINQIYTTKIDHELSHMYEDYINCYH